MAIDATTTVRDLAVQIPGATKVFEDLRIDYCCKGARSLKDACEAQGLALGEVLPRLEQVASRPKPPDDPSWSTRPLAELVAYVVDKHHAYTNAELDRLAPLLDKVVRVHGAAHPELAQLRDAFKALDADLRPHLMKEERVLFPYITAREASRACPPPCFGTVDNPIRMMHMEHDDAGTLLRRMRTLANDYIPPGGACGSFMALYAGLEALEKDLHEHIHLEENVLFPRAQKLERD